MNKREQSPIYQTRSTRVLNIDDIRRERGPRSRRLALAALGLITLIAVAILIGQGLRAAAEPSAAPAAGSRPEAAREQVLSELAEQNRPAAPAPTTGPQATAPAAAAATLTVTGTGEFGLRLRAAPGLAGATVAVLDEGDTVTPTGRRATADGLTWIELRAAEGAAGWAAADFLG